MKIENIYGREIGGIQIYHQSIYACSCPAISYYSKNLIFSVTGRPILKTPPAVNVPIYGTAETDLPPATTIDWGNYRNCIPRPSVWSLARLNEVLGYGTNCKNNSGAHPCTNTVNKSSTNRVNSDQTPNTWTAEKLRTSGLTSGSSSRHSTGGACIARLPSRLYRLKFTVVVPRYKIVILWVESSNVVSYLSHWGVRPPITHIYAICL